MCTTPESLFFSFCAVPGKSFRLEPVGDDYKLFHAVSASNQKSDNPKDRMANAARQLMASTFRFHATDCMGNASDPETVK